jgi:hypothetical protein
MASKNTPTMRLGEHESLATNTAGIKYISFRREGMKNLGTFH